MYLFIFDVGSTDRMRAQSRGDDDRFTFGVLLRGHSITGIHDTALKRGLVCLVLCSALLRRFERGCWRILRTDDGFWLFSVADSRVGVHGVCTRRPCHQAMSETWEKERMLRHHSEKERMIRHHSEKRTGDTSQLEYRIDSFSTYVSIGASSEYPTIFLQVFWSVLC